MRGLCFKCGERWGPGHQCGPTVQLHIVEEILEILQADQVERVMPGLEDEEVLMCVCKVALIGQTTPHTVRLVGSIAGKEVLILVDSGNSHSFVSEEVAERVQGHIRLQKPMVGKIVDGGVMSCT